VLTETALDRRIATSVELSLPTATERRPHVGSATRRLTRACVAGAAIGFVPFLAVLWDFGWRPLRTMTAGGVNGGFFDVQARALFRGDLHVPPGSLGIEAFLVDGRHYMYFQPFPALLRMPVLLVTDRLDGKLTAPSMLLGWIVLACVLVAMIRLVRRRLRGDAPVGRLEASALGALVTTITGGSTLVYLASQPWVYHEVYVWSTAFTLATATALIAAWDRPTVRLAAVSSALALATMLTRITAGWAMALAVVATGGWFLVRRRGQSGWRRPGWSMVAGGVAVLLIGTAVNWAKFQHPYRFPIRSQIWSEFSAHRKLALFYNDGRIDGPQFAWTTLTAYFRPDGVRFVSIFPFVTPPADPQRPLGGVFLDESVRTGSITALMPLLFVLAVSGLVVAFRPGGRGGAPALRIPLAGTLVMTGGVIAFGHVAQRYTSEFLPVLAIAAAVGIVVLAERLHGVSGRAKRVVLTGICLVTAYGIVANTAIGVVNSRQNWRGDRLADFIGLQLGISRLTGGPLDRYVRQVDALPAASGADELVIVGDCVALYVATGEVTGRWVPVEFRDRRFRLTVADDGLRPGSVSLMWFAGHTVRRLHAQVNLDGRVRLVMIGTPPDSSGRWMDVEPGDTIEVTVSGDTAESRFVATAGVAGTDDVSVVAAPMTEWDRQFRSTQITPSVALGGPAIAERVGLQVDAGYGKELDLCNRLR
jgi:hypothetical protein